MSDGTVVSIYGGVPLPTLGKPNERLVAWLEEQLERAKAGELVGLAGATLDKDLIGTYWLVGFTGGFSMLGAVECASRKLAQIAAGEDT